MPTAAEKTTDAGAPMPAKPTYQQRVLEMQLVQAKLIAGLDLTGDEQKLLVAHPGLAAVSPRVIKTEEGRLFIRLHIRAIETALHGEPRTPLPTGHHA